VQNEITERDFLLDSRGELRHRGFSKRPVLIYNPENVNVSRIGLVNRLRIKEWDYYGITTPDFYFSATVSNVGYMGLVFAYFIDFHDRTRLMKVLPTPMGLGCRLPRQSDTGDVHFHLVGVSMRFVRERERRVLEVKWRRFSRGADLHAELVLEQPEDLESIVVATPISKGHFYYNQKINCMPVSGRIRCGGIDSELAGDSALATLDWGRGVWEYRTFWNWASASGFLPDGRRFGLNLGAGFGDLSAATENCVFVEGKMTKYGEVKFEYDRSETMKPWRLVSDDGKLDLTLAPFFDSGQKTNLILASTQGHQMFGRYSGRAVTQDGEAIELSGLIGWAEEHLARW